MLTTSFFRLCLKNRRDNPPFKLSGGKYLHVHLVILRNDRLYRSTFTKLVKTCSLRIKGSLCGTRSSCSYRTGIKHCTSFWSLLTKKFTTLPQSLYECQESTALIQITWYLTALLKLVLMAPGRSESFSHKYPHINVASKKEASTWL